VGTERPRCVSSAAFRSSPIIDLTGYRHRATTEPSIVWAESGIVVLPRSLVAAVMRFNCGLFWKASKETAELAAA
jgi:hypothetical protein